VSDLQEKEMHDSRLFGTRLFWFTLRQNLREAILGIVLLLAIGVFGYFLVTQPLDVGGKDTAQSPLRSTTTTVTAVQRLQGRRTTPFQYVTVNIEGRYKSIVTDLPLVPGDKIHLQYKIGRSRQIYLGAIMPVRPSPTSSMVSTPSAH
jgi:hypothetical protein